MTATVRLAKRLAEMLACSRSEAEQYIAGGWVRVDGTVIEEPQFKVVGQKIELDPEASLLASTPVTLLLHKPPEFSAQPGLKAAEQLLQPDSHWARDPTDRHALRRHFKAQTCITPLESAASGLLIFSQEWRVQRKAQEDWALIEQELMVEIGGPVSTEALQCLNRGTGRDPGMSVKASLSSDRPGFTTLRFAIKGNRLGLIAQLCEQAGLAIVAIKRTRIGRLSLGSLPSAQWRYLASHERI